MANYHLACIHLTWNNRGELTHNTEIKYHGTGFDIKDAFYASPSMLLLSQLGIIGMDSYYTCGQLGKEVLEIVRFNGGGYKPIDPVIKGSAKIDLYGSNRDEKPRVIHTFSPQVNLFPNNSKVLDGVKNLVENYIIYTLSIVDPRNANKLKYMLLLMLHCFFLGAFPIRMSIPLQVFTRNISPTLYPDWCDLQYTEENFNKEFDRMDRVLNQ